MISDSVLQNVSKTLKYLDISRSNLKNEADLSAILYHLNIIYLAAEDLQLKKIPTNALAHVKYTLRYLSLRKSDFGKVLEKNMFNLIFNFPLMTELIELNLMECKINYLERGAFDSLPNLKILHLGKNNLVNLQDGWVLISPKISHLDLSWNGLAPQLSHLEMNTMGTALNLSIFTELKVLNLSNGIFINTKEIIESLGSNLQYLSLTNIDLKDFSDTIFQKLTDLEALDLSFNKNLKSIHMFSVNLFQHLKNLKTLILKGCRINTGSVYKGKDSKNVKNNTGILTGIKYLDLSYNNIREMDLTMFQLFPKLEVLKLTGNGITTWKTSLFNFGKNLKAIYLDENKIETMTPQMISDVKKLRRVKFGNNPFICDAYVYDVLRIAEHKFHRINEYKESLTSACLYDAGMDALEIISPGTSFKEDSFNTSLCNEDVNDRNSTLKNNNKTIILDWSENNYHCFSHAKGKFLPFTLVKDSFNNAYDSMRKEINGFVIYWLPVATVFGLGKLFSFFFQNSLLFLFFFSCARLSMSPPPLQKKKTVFRLFSRIKHMLKKIFKTLGKIQISQK